MHTQPGQASASDRPQAVGWERNKAGKLASRMVDLGPMMDPARLVARYRLLYLLI